eukprot:CAMPEP_0181292774 /NCGR_PEP_ID=MMETSP1101-20121128/2698_1 /TAXON_ID=46948 /ORGANISM="Rhodomonas abbreviata, Strain Caron Lab Isolate" /LENGTH=138 /DNA_ID=CAMNT_0023397291 /DNA_START=64 /DNA_END=476 /DNA_ORIENTATION=+
MSDSSFAFGRIPPRNDGASAQTTKNEHETHVIGVEDVEGKFEDVESNSKWRGLLASAAEFGSSHDFVPVKRYTKSDLLRLRPKGRFSTVEVKSHHIEDAHKDTDSVPLWVSGVEAKVSTSSKHCGESDSDGDSARSSS